MAICDIHQACDYIITRLKGEDEGSYLNNLKLQKLLYYSQAWYLAFTGQKLFEDRFQAWVHGPVNRAIYNRFKDTKSIYSEVTLGDVLDPNAADRINVDAKKHIDSVLEAYAQYSGVQLEYMTHNEEPWLEARHGFAPMARCEEYISEDTMTRYYRARVQATA